MLPLKLPVNSKLLAVEFWEVRGCVGAWLGSRERTGICKPWLLFTELEKQSYTQIFLTGGGGSVLLTPKWLKGQLYSQQAINLIKNLTIMRTPCRGHQ